VIYDFKELTAGPQGKVAEERERNL